jgi:hypothetical protein
MIIYGDNRDYPPSPNWCYECEGTGLDEEGFACELCNGTGVLEDPGPDWDDIRDMRNEKNNES